MSIHLHHRMPLTHIRLDAYSLASLVLPGDQAVRRQGDVEGDVAFTEKRLSDLASLVPVSTDDRIVHQLRPRRVALCKAGTWSERLI
jgi:hypothetical protein